MAQKCEPATQKALKLVGEALKLDSENADKEAYMKYLESISVIVSTLYNDQRTSYDVADSKCISAEQKQRLIDVARQCLDRIDVLSKKTSDAKDETKESKCDECFKTPYSFVPNPTKPSNKRASLEFPEPIQIQSTLPPPLIAVPATQNAKTSQLSPTSRLSILESIDWISPEEPNDETCIQRMQESVSPLEKAYHANRILIATYKKRSARAPNSYARINLSLELQRRIAENLQMARTQQEIYLRQLREKQEHHLDEVARKVAHGEEVNSMEFHYRRELCARMIEYEKSQTWIVNSKKQLMETPEKLDLVELIVRRILRDSNHPVTEELCKNSENLCQKIMFIITLNKSDNKQVDLMHKTLPAEQTETFTAAQETNPSISPNLEMTSNDDRARSPEKYNDDRDLEKADRDPKAFEDLYSHNVRDVQQAIKSGNVLMSSLKSTIKKQKQVLKKNPLKAIGQLKLKDDEDEKNLNNASQVQERENDEKKIEPLKFEELARHLESIAVAARDAVDFLVDLITLSYKQMESDESHERCYLVIEDHLFSKVWPSLMQLCKLAFVADEQQIKESMNRLQDCTPVTLGFDAGASNIQPSEENFKNAIQLLEKVVESQTPTKKLEVLVLVAKVLCDTSHPLISNETQAPKLKPIGADDLIPLLGYACIQSKIPQLILECHLLEHLIHPKYLMGEAGYCLTSLQTALQYIQMYEAKKPLDEASIETTV